MSNQEAGVDVDRELMTKCIALSRASGAAGEYPYGAIITRRGQVVASSTNRVKQDRDVTRHAEVVAISATQKELRTVSLDECTIYINAEPCAFCCYAIRESRISRVVYGLHSPHMGGVSKWNVLADDDLSRAMPEVFAPPPQIVAGYMAVEAEEALRDWNPVVAKVMRDRHLFEVTRPVTGPPTLIDATSRKGFWAQLMSFFRRNIFDRFGRR